MDLPERFEFWGPPPKHFEFHGPVCATIDEAINAWAEMCARGGLPVGGDLVFTKCPDGVSVGHSFINS